MSLVGPDNHDTVTIRSAWRMLLNQRRIGSAIWVLLTIVDNGPQISEQEIADALRIDQRTVRRHLARLAEEGILRWRPIAWQTNTYEVHLPTPMDELAL